MSSDFRLELNDQGIQALLKSPEMQGYLDEIASSKASAAGPGYESEVHVFSKRAVAHVYPGDFRAAQDNFDNNTLLKVVGV